MTAAKKNADARRGKPLSAEHKKKAIEVLKRYQRKGWNGGRSGYKHSQETIEKMRAYATGRHWTEEQRRKIMEHHKRKAALRPVKQKKQICKAVSQYTLTGELV